MDVQENNHSRNIKRILNNKPGFIPAIAWNMQHWFPYNNERVQFVIKTQTFHGVVCVDIDPKSVNVFIVGYADFATNGVAVKILIHQDELIDFISNLKSGDAPHRAPQDVEVPIDPTRRSSF